jgi:hypothetical protein
LENSAVNSFAWGNLPSVLVVQIKNQKETLDDAFTETETHTT